MFEIDFIFFLSVYFAGILTFLAPCTLPIIPAYLGYISGIRTGNIGIHEESTVRLRVVKAALGFVIGFSSVFILFGILVGFAGQKIAAAEVLINLRGPLTVFGGILMVLFGLILLGALRVSLFTKERRVHLPNSLRPGTSFGALFLGMAFAFGWTPCVGPILGAVLTVAGSTETALSGACLLLVFSAGYAMPFLGFAYFFSTAERIVERITPFLKVISRIGGTILIIIGVHTTFGGTPLTNWFYTLLFHLDATEHLLPYL